MIFRVAQVIVITAIGPLKMLTTEECPEMNVGTGKFSDVVEMTVQYYTNFSGLRLYIRARLGRPDSRLLRRASVAGLGGAYRGGRPPTAWLLRP